ncbi:MAG TPA: MerR family transcriptional regulator, partial [Ilumatobacteraceae bacterium]
DRPGIEGLFASQGSYSLDDLVEKSGLDAALIGRLRDIGLLAEPEALGHEVFDDNDLNLLRAVVELRDIGMTEDILIELGVIYVRHFRALQNDVHAMLAGTDRDWDQEEMVAVQRRLTANSSRMIPAVDRVLNYVHQRTIQRLTLEAVRTANETHTGVGGVRLDDDTP